MAQANSGTFATPEGQLSFCDSLFEKRSMDGVKFNYGCTLIFDDKHRPFFMDIIRKVVAMKWGDKGQRDFDKGLIKSPLLEGDGPQAHSKQSGELWGGMGKGKFFIRPTAQEDAQPQVFYRSKHVQASREEIYAGCWGKGILNAYTYENPSGGRGVSFGIRAFQKFRDGEPLGGRQPFDPDKWIVDIEDTSETVDPFS
jgi:hypothetical protein